MIYGERVRQVRELHGLTQHELADQVDGLTQSQLSRVERGQHQPDELIVEAIAATTSVLPSLLERAPAVSFDRPFHYRARKAASQAERAESLRWVELVLEHAEVMFGLCAPIPMELQPLPGADPETAAATFRRVLRLTAHQPVPYLVLALERLGVRVLGLPIGGRRHDAFSSWSEGRPLVAVLANAPGDRLRFSIAHEVGHLILHSAHDTLGETEEREADRFAAELLLPRDAARLLMTRNVTLTQLRAHKVEWGVSLRVLIRQARNAGLIDQDRYTSLFRQISARGWNQNEPGHVPIERPRGFRKLVEVLYGDDARVLAKEASWTDSLALQVIAQHASASELPHERITPQLQAENVRYFRPRVV